MNQVFKQCNANQYMLTRGNRRHVHVQVHMYKYYNTTVRGAINKFDATRAKCDCERFLTCIQTTHSAARVASFARGNAAHARGILYLARLLDTHSEARGRSKYSLHSSLQIVLATTRMGVHGEILYICVVLAVNDLAFELETCSDVK